jgi:hypothetical protein
MDARTAKRMAREAGLDLYYSTEWASWGLVDPALNVESLWLSPSELRGLPRNKFAVQYIAVMQNRIHPDATGEFPIAS